MLLTNQNKLTTIKAYKYLFSNIFKTRFLLKKIVKVENTKSKLD